LEAAQRAWVGPSDAHLDGKFTPEGKLTKGADVDVVISYLNTGREPARSFSAGIDEFITTTEDNGREDAAKRIGDDLQACLAIDSVAATEVIYPATGFSGGSERRVAIHGTDVDDDLTNGGKVITVYGCFTYLTFEKVRHSAFCFYYEAPKIKPVHLGYCPSGSYAD
jgi:hypothetical protein